MRGYMKEIKLMVEGGKASGGPPLGPALGPLGVNTAEVVRKINEMTTSFTGIKVPVLVKVDPKTKAFEIEIGTPPIPELLKKEANIKKGHGKAWKEGSVGNISMESVVNIAKSTLSKSFSDLRGHVKEVLSTARSIGLTVEGKDPKEINLDEYESYLSG